MNTAKIHATKTVSPKHRTGMQWYACLAHAARENAVGPAGNGAGLKRSIEFYSLYAETGDERYLGLCEDFLKDSLSR